MNRRFHGLPAAARRFAACIAAALMALLAPPATLTAATPGIPLPPSDPAHTRILIDDDWRFTRNDPPDAAASLLYDVRPQVAADNRGGRPGRGPAAQPPAPAPAQAAKSWILPTGNAFLSDPTKTFPRPAANLGQGVSYIAPDFDDAAWQKVNLPHDYAIEGPFNPQGGGGMGRLPTAGVAWYRKNLAIPADSANKSIFIDVDGAMSYSEVWLNGKFVGGWPYGYSSYRLNLTPFAKPGQPNELAIRLDNPPTSSRWYPSAGIYRNVWLETTNPVHVGHWGTYITTSDDVSPEGVTIKMDVAIDNDSDKPVSVKVVSIFQSLDADDHVAPIPVGGIAGGGTGDADLDIAPGKTAIAHLVGMVPNPKLWSTKTPNRYRATTLVINDGKTIDTCQTPFGIRTLKYDPNQGLLLNGEHVRIQGVCDHADLGALGMAFNIRAAERQLEILKQMGCNALRTAHNPPAPELLDLCDKMGFLVMDEAFDVWANSKGPANDYHLLFNDWHEQDLRAMLRRDRNHPSIILWSIGNEISEQGGDPRGFARELTDICHQEDPTRITISAMNSASPTSNFVPPIDAIGLNYQGAGLNPFLRPGPRATPQYPAFHQAFPNKFILGSETASTLSSRGIYTFPVADLPGTAAAANAGELNRQVSSYDMYFADWAMIPEREWAIADKSPYVAGEFVWSGFDYLGEPTPFDSASRSSYFGMIDLAGFPKDRYYLYQSRWRPDLPMAHILPHWTWPDRIGQVTPVHVYTSGDEAELFLNGQSLGRKKKGAGEYRLCWDDVTYQPGELHVVAYKDGKQWATGTIKTAGDAAQLLLTPDRSTIAADGKDLSFVTLTVADKDAQMVPRSLNLIHFSLDGPGEIVATDNGDPTDLTPFPSPDRKAFNGLALAIIRARPGDFGTITLTAHSDGLPDVHTTIIAQSPPR